MDMALVEVAVGLPVKGTYHYAVPPELGGAAQLAGVSSFGVDALGELFVVSYNRGVILKIVGPPPTPGTLRIIRH